VCRPQMTTSFPLRHTECAYYYKRRAIDETGKSAFPTTVTLDAVESYNDRRPFSHFLPEDSQ
jgi:hypothetical protein